MRPVEWLGASYTLFLSLGKNTMRNYFQNIAKETAGINIGSHQQSTRRHKTKTNQPTRLKKHPTSQFKLRVWFELPSQCLVLGEQKNMFFPALGILYKWLGIMIIMKLVKMFWSFILASHIGCRHASYMTCVTMLQFMFHHLLSLPNRSL